MKEYRITQLPTECIELILDHLNATKDLVSLLTVNKFFFGAATRRLYSDPIEIIKSHPKDHQLKPLRQLLALILRCSPVNTMEVQSLRMSFQSDILDMPWKPTVNYVSLIKNVQYEATFFGPPSALAIFYPLTCCGEPLLSRAGLHDAVTWAVCDHRLSEMHSLEVSWFGLFRLTYAIYSVVSIPSIRLLNMSLPGQPFFFWTEIQKRDAASDLSNISYFVEKWSEAYAKLPHNKRTPVEFLFPTVTEGTDEWWSYEPFAGTLKTIFRQTPAPVSGEHSTLDLPEWECFFQAPKPNAPSRARTLGYRTRIRTK